MTERNGMRYGLLGLIVLSLLIALGLIVATQSSPTSEPAAPSATAAPVLESLAALDGRAPARREPRLHQTSHGKPRIQSALPRMSVAVEMNHRTMVRLGLYAAQRSTGLVSQLPT